jgi:hypothetical protein
MKIAELVTGLRYMVTREQQELIDMLKEQQVLNRYDLDERQQEIVEQMSRSGLVDRIYNEESKTVSYKLFRR